ncbi:uncharacterized protein LOC144626852 [Crassostrea virginica]
MEKPIHEVDLAERTNDFVPYERVRDTIARIEAIKATNAGVYTFLPNWADENYFQNLHGKKTNEGTDEIPTGKGQETVKFSKARDINKQKVEEYISSIIENAQKKYCHETATKQHTGEMTWNFLGRMPENAKNIKGLKFNKQNIKDYVLSIIENAVSTLCTDSRIQQQHSKARVIEKVPGNKIEKTSFLGCGRIVGTERFQECIDLDKMKNAQETKKKPTTISEDSPSLKSNDAMKFIPRKLFLSRVETFRIDTGESASNIPAPEMPRPTQAKLPQYRFLCTTGLAPVVDKVPSRTHSKLTKWRKRLHKFLGLKPY